MEEEEGDERELQLLPSPHNRHKPSSSSSLKFLKPSSSGPMTTSSFSFQYGSSLDLQLSISLPAPRTGRFEPTRPAAKESGTACLETLKWQAAENMRMAAMEKAYAERLREMTRREMELAQLEFARARHVWERAREDVERADKIKDKVTRRLNSTCMEITCQSCRQKFCP